MTPNATPTTTAIVENVPLYFGVNVRCDFTAA